MAGSKTIIWDFDGTLAVRPSYWSGTMVEVLDEFFPDHGIDVEQIRKHMRNVYPWDTPENPHFHLSTPQAWWSNMEKIIATAYKAVGIKKALADDFARLFHKLYVDPEGFVLYDDTVETLDYLSSNGWRSIILSNHVPELPQIVDGLGLGCYFDACISSANTGYEKPNPEVFNIALSICGYPDTVWMVGDNVRADVKGANSLGIPAVLVHNTSPNDIKYNAGTLKDVIDIIIQNTK